jgi:hypothetical protein
MTQTEDYEIEAHGGHDLEAGLLERVREWTDLFPWWRLIRTLRLAASPTLLSITAATLFVWLLGIRTGRFFPDGFQNRTATLEPSWLLGWVWTIAIWAPAAILLTRQGGLLTAGRTMVGLRSGWSLCRERTWRGWLAGLLPPLAALTLAVVMILPLGWLARIAPYESFVQVAAGWLAALLAIPSGLIAFGGVVAVPLSWAALGNEQDRDPLNALSRGYEAPLRRPLHLAFYLGFASLVAWVVWWIAAGIASAAILMSEWTLGLSGCSSEVHTVASATLSSIPWVVVTTLGWGLLGGIYLLLRYDTGGQEVEDLWEQEQPDTPSLPKLPLT